MLKPILALTLAVSTVLPAFAQTDADTAANRNIKREQRAMDAKRAERQAQSNYYNKEAKPNAETRKRMGETRRHNRGNKSGHQINAQ